MNTGSQFLYLSQFLSFRQRRKDEGFLWPGNIFGLVLHILLSTPKAYI